MNSIKLFFGLMTTIAITSVVVPTEGTDKLFCKVNYFDYINDYRDRLQFVRPVLGAAKQFHWWTADYDPIAGKLINVEHKQTEDNRIVFYNSLKAYHKDNQFPVPYDLISSKIGTEDAYLQPLVAGNLHRVPIPDSKGLRFQSIIRLNKTKEWYVIGEKRGSKDQYMYRLDNVTVTPTGKQVVKFFGCGEPTQAPPTQRITPAPTPAPTPEATPAPTPEPTPAPTPLTKELSMPSTSQPQQPSSPLTQTSTSLLSTTLDGTVEGTPDNDKGVTFWIALTLMFALIVILMLLFVTLLCIFGKNKDI